MRKPIQFVDCWRQRSLGPGVRFAWMILSMLLQDRQDPEILLETCQRWFLDSGTPRLGLKMKVRFWGASLPGHATELRGTRKPGQSTIRRFLIFLCVCVCLCLKANLGQEGWRPREDASPEANHPSEERGAHIDNFKSLGLNPNYRVCYQQELRPDMPQTKQKAGFVGFGARFSLSVGALRFRLCRVEPLLECWGRGPWFKKVGCFFSEKGGQGWASPKKTNTKAWILKLRPWTLRAQP